MNAKEYLKKLDRPELRTKDKKTGFYMITPDEIEDYTKEMMLDFTEWARKNFENDPEEEDSKWLDLFYILDKIEQRNYTTSELLDFYLNNINKIK